MSDYLFTGSSSGVFATAGNYSPSGPPTTGDTLTFDGRMTQGLTGADESAITLTTLTQYASGQFVIGSPTTFLKIGATVCNLGVPSTDGSTLSPGDVALDFAAIQTTVTVYGSSNAGTSSLPPVLLKGTHASNKLTVIGGTVGVAVDAPGVASTFLTSNIVGTNANVIFGSGCTLTTINQDAGAFLLNCAVTTINQYGGTFETRGSGAITTINLGGKAAINSTGTITTLNVQPGGVADFSGSFAAITVTNCNVYGNGKILDPNGRVTWTNGVALAQGARSSQITLKTPGTLSIA